MPSIWPIIEQSISNVLPGLKLIRNLTAAYIVQNNITARNPDMLADVFNHSYDEKMSLTSLKRLMIRKEYFSTDGVMPLIVI